eukprot:XP_011242663.1 PREDICTED: nidogen-1-like isoform X2 [Mus musculus]
MLDASGCSWAMWTWALLQLLLLVGPGGCLNRQELFPFGPGQGDLELEAGDDVVSPSLELIGELSFYDRTDITSVYVQILPFYHTSSRKTPCVCFSKASSHKTASRNTSHDTTESPEKPDISTSA